MKQPKYEKGQQVWKGASAWTDKKVQCPDCLGTMQWTLTTPVGETFQVNCKTCEGAWSKCTGTISIWDFEPKYITQLTIGSIRYDSEEKDEGRQYSYMCEETGVGSGNVYYEEGLFLTRDEAFKYAKAEAAKQIQYKIDENNKSAKRKKQEGSHKPYKERKIAELMREIKQLEIRGY